MVDVMNMEHTQFKAELAKRTTPEKLLENANCIYDYLTEIFEQDCRDSLLREWSFQWWSDTTKEDYKVIYNKWMRIRHI